eukprot:TRINITY_DN1308_c0_g3_i1.p1 TRINITY_DN1308_c0_g3~~TRINITY_DN1308_c0_g3_i1.p1  ORF type:complete len:557 (+),score=118.37 TRINITY_DN1308_c0_g3_i1:29-1699(+)
MFVSSIQWRQCKMACRFSLVVLLAVFACQASSDAECSGEDGTCAAGSLAKGSEFEPFDPLATDLSWNPKTITVVLPCAGEGDFAKKTVESVAKSVPGGSGGSILVEIVVVDDGSKPPLTTFLKQKFLKEFNVKMVRHEEAIGLMGAKAAGAAVATGDIIIFFDCHVAPQGDWYKEFLKESAPNYRRIVVPVITDLDIDTWTERNRHHGHAKCYLTWDVDFKWITSNEPYMPVLSGGLLGISRRWWHETGGYDEGMRGWGGENIDQSLRTWLCGGEIYSMSKAFVAHMWRKPSDPRTNAKYHVAPMSLLTNKARAALAWYGNYTDKIGDYPDMKHVGFGPNGKKPVLDVSNIRAIGDRLQCKPFAWFLWRFRHIYDDGGMLPKKTFKLKHVPTDHCLSYMGPAGTHPRGYASAGMAPCTDDVTKGWHPDRQRFHLGNRNPKTGKCCIGLRIWNTDQCLGSPTRQGRTFHEIPTGVCDVSGMQSVKWRYVEKSNSLAPGQLEHEGGCVVVNLKGVLEMEPCKKLGEVERGPWKRVGGKVPIETELYDKALQEHPDLFK